MSPSLDPTPQFLAIEDARRVFDLIQRAQAGERHTDFPGEEFRVGSSPGRSLNMRGMFNPELFAGEE